MKNYIIIAAFIVFCLYSVGLVWIGYKYPHPPCPIAEPNTAKEDSLKAAASMWEGHAKAFRSERDEARRLRDIYKKSIPPTSSIIKKNTNAIRAAGLSAAVDTLDRRPE